MRTIVAIALLVIVCQCAVADPPPGPSGKVIAVSRTGDGSATASLEPASQVQARDVFLVTRGKHLIGEAMVLSVETGRVYLLPKASMSELMQVGDSVVFLRHAPIPTGPAQPLPSRAPRLGDVLTGDGFELKVSGLKRLGKSVVVYSTLKREAMGEWVSVLVDYRNTGTSTTRLVNGEYTLLDENDHSYQSSTDGIGFSISSGGKEYSTQLPPETGARFYLLFDVTPRASGLRLQYKPYSAKDALEVRLEAAGRI